MRRLFLMLAAIFVSLSLTGGAIAHAAEPVACIDTSTAASMGHTTGDADQVPKDAEKGYPHHHGGCHGHQVCDRVSEAVVVTGFHTAVSLPLRSLLFVPLATADPALRPPIA